MKKLAIISAIAFSGLLYNTADAQFGIHIGIHLFPHRLEYAPGPVVVAQAPVDQYVNDDDFYYLPDLGAYYSVDEQLYYYFNGQDWISSAYLPGVYRDYNWKDERRVEIREARPYLHNDFYRNRYRGFDNDLAHNRDHFREGFDSRQNRDAYNAPQHFDNRGFDKRVDNNRGGDDQQFDNRNGNDQRFDNRGGHDQRFDNHRDGVQFDNSGNQGGFDRKYDGGNKDNNRGGQQFDQYNNRRNYNEKQAGQDGMHSGNNRDGDRQQSQNDRGYNGH